MNCIVYVTYYINYTVYCIALFTALYVLTTLNAIVLSVTCKLTVAV